MRYQTARHHDYVKPPEMADITYHRMTAKDWVG